jgi:uncharacterized phage protein (TIGR01671 family)
MRPIKFRAWDKKRKRMYKVLNLYVDSIGVHSGIWADVEGFDVIEDKNIRIQIQPKDIEVMQFTGLKDKNGKEIYEGDVVTAFLEKRAVVHFGDYSVNGSDYYSNNTTAGFYILYIDDSEESGIDPSETTVIGNIHETPELLK